MSRSSRTRKQTKKRSGPRLAGLLSVVLLVSVMYAWQTGEIQRWLARFGIDLAEPGVTVASSDDGAIAVFFTTPHLVYPDVPRDRVVPPYEAQLIADIDAARSEIDVAMFEYNLRSYALALARASERGVAVRLALDRESLENPTMARWAGIVEDAGAVISWQEKDAFLHSKIFIIDRAVLWTGSANATINGTYRNNNNMLRIRMPELIDNYLAELDQMHAGLFGNSKESITPHPLIRSEASRIETYFSPQDRPSDRLVEVLSAARSSIRFLAFSYTSDPIGAAMVERHAAGIEVQGVFEKRNANGIGSEFERLEQAGIEVYRDGNCYTMHHKFIVIDERIVITGSYNFTGRGEEVNDENLLIIEDSALARAYIEEFARVWQQAQNPTRCEG
jgi:phosphatidylserine/phosphatidylglycerophosphate/cardiolipin synthase-like enzyme